MTELMVSPNITYEVMQTEQANVQFFTSSISAFSSSFLMGSLVILSSFITGFTV